MPPAVERNIADSMPFAESLEEQTRRIGEHWRAIPSCEQAVIFNHFVVQSADLRYPLVADTRRIFSLLLPIFRE